ncbi:hypothetical protein RHD99_15950 [Buttiauxella selenatireducens]|uniref:Uncharacterized protein n=1 Tax=Buttiauxella selenatireducens TaxID=3073902 RepID=A0ABY9S6G7_9ENTR|nr:hypothetical protein [Buttiauxella sp. R73]WMY72954.1 hypothetical protein RHD99_15950 [Buttiauxella sp. R73]
MKKIKLAMIAAVASLVFSAGAAAVNLSVDGYTSNKTVYGPWIKTSYTWGFVIPRCNYKRNVYKNGKTTVQYKTDTCGAGAK